MGQTQTFFTFKRGSAVKHFFETVDPEKVTRIAIQVSALKKLEKDPMIIKNQDVYIEKKTIINGEIYTSVRYSFLNK